MGTGKRLLDPLITELFRTVHNTHPYFSFLFISCALLCKISNGNVYGILVVIWDLASLACCAPTEIMLWDTRDFEI